MNFKIDSINPLWHNAFCEWVNSKQHLTLNKKDSKKAFTLAEVIIVLTVLGIVAMLTVPSLIQHQTEVANRTKIKRAISDYDRVIQNITIENDLHSDTELAQWADTKAKNNCANTSKYFKVAGGSGCTFKTPDGVWWDIDDIMRPIIALKEADLSNLDNDTTFKLVTSYDANSRAFRTDDLAYESTGENKGDMKKLFSYINPDSSDTNSDGENIGDTYTKDLGSHCDFDFDNMETINCTSTPIIFTKKTVEKTSVDCPPWVEESGASCNIFPSSVEAGDLYYSEPFYISYTDTTDGNYWKSAQEKCEAQGTHVASLAELKATNCGGIGCGSGTGFFWASEEHSSDYGYYFDGVNGSFTAKYNNNGQVVCIGN